MISNDNYLAQAYRHFWLRLVVIFVHMNNFRFVQFGWEDAILHRFGHNDGAKARNKASSVS